MADHVSKLFAILGSRAVLGIDGPDRADFLQGLISNDVTKLARNVAIYAALLTAQGRFLHDFFLANFGDSFLLDAEAARLPDLTRRLSIYKLRSRVTIAPASEFMVCAALGQESLSALGLPSDVGAAVPFAGGVAFTDPRNRALGARVIVPHETEPALTQLGFARTDASDYDRLRLSLGIPDGSRDLVPEKSLLMESGFDDLNGIDWSKGCYIGQELTARMKYRALVKKQLVPVTVAGPMPAPGTAIMSGEDEVGEIRSGRDGAALALLRLDAMERAPLLAGAAIISVRSR
jgi:tRNA-modifying protein YgfZ